MISETQPQLEALLEQGRAAALAGDTLAARNSFRRAAELAPECAEAWRGLGATASVLRERRTYFLRAHELDPSCAQTKQALGELDTWLAAGRLIAPAALRDEAQPNTPPPSLNTVVTQAPDLAPRFKPGLIGAGMLCLLTMTMLTTVGALIFTSVLGYFMAFILGPLVGELMLRLSDALSRVQRGRAAQIVLGAGVGIGGMAVLVLGGTLLPAIGLPLTADTIAMARSMGAADVGLTLLFHPAMAVFVGSAVAGTVYRVKQ